MLTHTESIEEFIEFYKGKECVLLAEVDDGMVQVAAVGGAEECLVAYTQLMEAGDQRTFFFDLAENFAAEAEEVPVH